MSGPAPTTPSGASSGSHLSSRGLNPGVVLGGRYRAVRFIARGGMGEVWEVEDLTLGARVALKIVQPGGGGEATNRERLRREVQLARRVTHPNVCRLFDIVTVVLEDPDGSHHELVGLTMEFLEGETLAERLARPRRLLPARTLDIARQIASALSAAHAAGVIHRDLKSSNVILENRENRSGFTRAVVTDFGLARPAPSSRAAEPEPLTEAHTVMGTTEYMAPEQARGEELTPACDVYAFGVVLYEMLTGRRPFSGETPMAVLLQAARSRPAPPSTEVRGLDPHWDAVILRCLAWEATERFRDGSEVLTALDSVTSGGAPVTVASPVVEGVTAVEQSRPRHRRHRIAAALAFAVIAILGALLAVRLISNDPAPPLESPTEEVQLTTWPGLEVDPSFSPDGRSLAFSANPTGSFEIYVKELGPGGRERSVTTGGHQCFQPSWSPDGSTLAYFSAARHGIWLVSSNGGEPRRLTEFGSHPEWSPDGRRLVFQSDPTAELSANAAHALPPSTLWIVGLDGERPTPLTRVGMPPGGHGAPDWSPDGRRVVFTASDRRWSTIWSVAVSGGDEVELVAEPRAAFDPVITRDGSHLLFSAVSEGERYGVWSLPINPSTGLPIGPAVQVESPGLASARQFAVSRDGRTIAHTAMSTVSNLWGLHLEPGRGRPVGEPFALTAGSGRNSRPAFAPDGRRIAFERWQVGRNQDLWITAPDGSESRQVTVDPGREMSPSWLPDGRSLVFVSDRSGFGLWAIDLVTGRERPLAELGPRVDSVRVSPDGTRIAFHTPSASGVFDIWVANIDATGARQLTFDSELAGFPSWSPDGRWLAFERRRGNSDRLMVIPSDGGDAVQLTFGEGRDWAWSWAPDSDRIVFASLRDGRWDLRWVRRTTGEEQRLTAFDRPNGYLRYPAWSPLDDLVVFERAETAGDLWLVRQVK